MSLMVVAKHGAAEIIRRLHLMYNVQPQQLAKILHKATIDMCSRMTDGRSKKRQEERKTRAAILRSAKRISEQHANCLSRRVKETR